MGPTTIEDIITWTNREFNTEADDVCKAILNNPIRCYNTHTINNPHLYYDKRPNLD